MKWLAHLLFDRYETFSTLTSATNHEIAFTETFSTLTSAHRSTTEQTMHRSHTLLTLIQCRIKIRKRLKCNFLFQMFFEQHVIKADCTHKVLLNKDSYRGL